MGFSGALRAHGIDLRRRSGAILQLNVGKLCNQTCIHCHVGAGPGRAEVMTRETADRVIEWMRRHPPKTVDITGGAPELCPEFRRLAVEARRLGARVMVRCNLTVIFEPGQEDLPGFYREHLLELVCSLPCYLEDSVDLQRGAGVFEQSIRALRRMNALGYGIEDDLRLTLVYNPVGPTLPPDQATLERDYKRELRARHDVEFHDLICITNLPVTRFELWLAKTGKLAGYQELLETNFNASTVDDLMCLDTINVGWRGELFDCDFNQMVDLPMAGSPRFLWDVDPDSLAGEEIATGSHCFGCTAGSGSSCGGALA